MTKFGSSLLSVFLGFILIFATFQAGYCLEKTTSNKVVRIGFHFYKPGKIYQEAFQGVMDGLELEGLVVDSTIYKSERNQDFAKNNLRDLDNLNLDVIISFSSAGTRIANSLGLKTPLLASVINHPISLGIEKKGSTQRPNISGTSYYIDAHDQLDLYLDLFPKTKTVGMIYDGNNPAGYLAEEPLMRAACEARELKFVSKAATGRHDLSATTEALLKEQIGIVIIPTNLQIYNNLDLVLTKTNPLNIPVVSMNKQGVEKGAIAALFADTYKTGRQMVTIIQEIINHDKSTADIPFRYPDVLDLIINLKAAADLDYEFNPNILGRASIVLN